MLQRDVARDIAKIYDSNVDWAHYRAKRNLCTKLQRQDRASFFENMYERMERENVSKKDICNN